MKKVVSATEVAHLWANKLQDEARVAGNGDFYFNGDTIYSYGSHFPIAAHYNGIVLFTLRTYSNTTAKHIRMVRSASSHLTKVYCWQLPNGKNDTRIHNANIDYWLKCIKNDYEKVKTARSRKGLYLDDIETQKDELKKYCDLFGIKLNKSQKELISATGQEKYAEHIAKEQARKKKFQADIERKGAKLWAEYLSQWHNNTENEWRKGLTERDVKLLNEYNKLFIDENNARLRVIGDEVVSSKGSRLPIAVAERVYKWYTTKLNTGGCNGECDYKILGYEVKQVNEGGLIVGCHDIPAIEINSIARQLNWKVN